MGNYGVHGKQGMIKEEGNREKHERHEKALKNVKSGIVREMLELRGMVG